MDRSGIHVRKQKELQVPHEGRKQSEKAMNHRMTSLLQLFDIRSEEGGLISMYYRRKGSEVFHWRRDCHQVPGNASNSRDWMVFLTWPSGSPCKNCMEQDMRDGAFNPRIKSMATRRGDPHVSVWGDPHVTEKDGGSHVFV